MRLRAHLAVVLSLLVAPAADAAEGIPEYSVPASLSDAGGRETLVERWVEVVVSEKTPACQEGSRILGSLGRPAMPAVIRALGRADWFGRSLLMAAVAESGTPEVEPVLAKGATDPSWAVRQMAARGLGRSTCAGPGEALHRLCRDESWRVRSAAAWSLRVQVSRGVCARAPAVLELVRLLSDPDRDVRLLALNGLGLLRAQEGKQAFLDGYRSDDEKLRETCFTALLRLEGAQKDLIAALEAAMAEQDDSTFLKAAVRYAELTGPKILTAHGHRLTQFLRIDSVQSAKVFEKIGRPAVPVLLTFLREHYSRPGRLPTQGDLSRTVLDIVQKILDEDAAPVLREILTDWTEALPAQRHAADLARRHHAKALVPTFRRLYSETGFRDIRKSLLKGLAAARSPDLAEFLQDAILSGDSRLQSEACVILLGRPDLDLTGSILLAIEREEQDDRLVARLLEVLQQRRSPDLFAVCKELLSHPDPGFRRRAASWMPSSGAAPEKLLSALISAFDAEDGRDRTIEGESEPDLATRNRVVRAILAGATDGGGLKAVPFLLRAAGDPDPFVREAALDKLRKLRDPRALPLALRLVDSEKEETPRAGAWLLVASHAQPEAVARVERELGSGDEERRLRVLKALKQVEEGMPVPRALVTGLEGGGWETESRVLAVDVLTARGGANFVDLLSRLAKTDPAPDIRAEAVRGLGEAGSPAANAALLSLLPGEDESLAALDGGQREVVLEAVSALGYLGSADSAPALLRLLEENWPLALKDDSDDRHHLEAAGLLVTALGRIGAEDTVPVLVKLLFTPELYHDYALLAAEPQQDQASLLGLLVKALVRFPDDRLTAVGSDLLDHLRESGDAYRVDEGYLGYCGRLFANPRRSGIRRPQPRPGFAALLTELVREVAPRESPADHGALEWLWVREASLGQFESAAAHHASHRDLLKALNPFYFGENEDYERAVGDLLEGMALMEAGREVEGMERYRAGLARDPDDHRILNLYAWYLTETGREPEEALRAARAASRQAASDPGVLDTLGWVLHRAGNHREAAVVLWDAVLRDRKRTERAPPGEGFYSPEILFHFAAAAVRSGRIEDAVPELIDAMAMDDNLATAARASKDFEPLRDSGVLEAAIEKALKALPR